MKEIFKGALVTAPILVIILFFALSGKEEIKQEQRVHEAVEDLKSQSFDNDFDDAWRGRPRAGSKEMQERNNRIAELKENVKTQKSVRDGLDAEFKELKGDLNQAIQEEDARLAGNSLKSASAVQSVISK